MRHSICANELSFEKHEPDNYGILRTMHRTCAPCSESHGVRVLIWTRILINLLESTCCYHILHCFHQIAFAFKSIFVEPTQPTCDSKPLSQMQWCILDFGEPSTFRHITKNKTRVTHVSCATQETKSTNREQRKYFDAGRTDYKFRALIDANKNKLPSKIWQ